MLFGRFVELLGAVAQRAFDQQVDNPSATRENPVDRQVAVYKAQHLNPVELAYALGIAANHANGFLLALRHTGRSHLDAVYVDLTEQLAGNDELLVRQKAHSARLLAVAQRAVHDFHLTWNDDALRAYLFCCSHASILSLFSSRKSMSSRPFIRQCFL